MLNSLDSSGLPAGVDVFAQTDANAPAGTDAGPAGPAAPADTELLAELFTCSEIPGAEPNEVLGRGRAGTSLGTSCSGEVCLPYCQPRDL